MAASPNRFESLAPPVDRSWKQTLWAVLGIVMFGAMLVAATVYTAPALVSDWQIRDAARPVANAGVTDGRCNSKLVFHICDMTLNLRLPSGGVSRRVNYVFTDVHVGNYTVRVVADPARPELATTDMALDKLMNRTITLVVVLAVLLALTVLPTAAMIRNRRPASRAA